MKMNINCTKCVKFICYRDIRFLMGITILKYLLLFLIVFTGCLNGRIIHALGSEDDFKKYINEDNFKYYRNGLFLGMFNSQREADEFLKQNTINPITLEKYDFAIAFGMS